MSVIFDFERAEKFASSILLGANLDEVRFSGSYVLMRFISDKHVAGQNVYVDIEFYGLSDILEENNSSEYFDLSRSLFLGGIYKFIGLDVERVYLSEVGDLNIEIGRSLVKLRAAGESVDMDDFYWSLRIEASDRDPVGEYKSISCVLTEKGVAYFAKKSD